MENHLEPNRDYPFEQMISPQSQFESNILKCNKVYDVTKTEMKAS